MSNEYHLQFLHNFTDHGVRFLIIGGQARHVYIGSVTRDLDLWVAIDPASTPSLETALVRWSREYPLHTQRPMTSPIKFSPKGQQKFPDAECWFMTRAGDPMEILPADGIDILTAIGDHDFDAFYDRAFMQCVDGMALPFLSAGDLPIISPAKSQWSDRCPLPGAKADIAAITALSDPGRGRENGDTPTK